MIILCFLWFLHMLLEFEGSNTEYYSRCNYTCIGEDNNTSSQPSGYTLTVYKHGALLIHSESASGCAKLSVHLLCPGSFQQNSYSDCWLPAVTINNGFIPLMCRTLLFSLSNSMKFLFTQPYSSSKSP